MLTVTGCQPSVAGTHTGWESNREHSAGTGNPQILLIVGEVPGDSLVIYSFSSEFHNCVSVKGSLFASNVENLTKTMFKESLIVQTEK